MKKVLSLFICLSLLGCFAAFTGCQTSPQTVLYQSAGTISATVPVAMAAWDGWVKSGKASTNQELEVKAAYEKYQAAFAVACDAGAVYAATSVTNSTGAQQASLALQQAIANSTQSISDLETLIKSFGVTF